ncbi:AlbA family DNA-binding domain-containing protein [Clostridium luticellarii]|jgi:predicted HTH transcriptional regulator|uniref:Divergent AAA domain protein n=1 Tax=Clostridium luticellarii TaxID=1691940 RepID=A0A2T0BNC0_9CLOT|nr:RNA-binding domain-containing protein [Clostridium luticellarii]MCI1945442.1 putative DNA binding domain-containing protein [Clostridium luticellarii]MCI1968775.1 putative DNA binding domain-containing protein [Clostridium luticellarii]MCI1994951.1 putative DNA binding domain-containing protein [Clostridium luticellarii]MCI2040202.1 putative DNA binding domain-containing protein [Clostridium luticellarii]PRR85366.1 Divergent AAA domain protein [Clostridium luticellarii]
MNIKKFLSLLKRSEGPKLDFKQCINVENDSGRKELAKDICAIANSRGGRGYLIIGIEDKTKRIVGISEVNFSEEKIQQIVSSRIDPPIPVSLEILQYNGRDVAVISIYDSPQKPYQMRDNGSFYIRRGSTNDTMRKQEIISALQENLGINVELCPIPHSDLNCIDDGIVNRYFLSQGIEINHENRLELMENASIIYMDKNSGKYMATLGGLLIFSKINNICIPHNMIKIVNNINRNSKPMVIIQGDLISMMDEAEHIIRKIINVKSYPVKAVDEGIREAVVYRDYSDFSRGIEVVLGYNSIVITSPGILINRKNTDFYNYANRNMWIYEKIIALDTKERSISISSGFNRIRKEFKNKGKVKFINSIKNFNFKVIYPGIKNFK